MAYGIYATFEGDLGVAYSNANKKYGVVTASLNPIIKSNYLDQSLVGVTAITILIFKQSFLRKYASSIKKGVNVVLIGDLVSSSTYSKSKPAISEEEIQKLNSACVISLGRGSSLTILSEPKELKVEEVIFSTPQNTFTSRETATTSINQSIN
jgi:hypothetical protein